MDIGQQQADAKQTTSLIGQTFHKNCPDDDTAYRTFRVERNFATGNIQTYVSNPVLGNPESLGLEPLPPSPHIKVNSCNNVLPLHVLRCNTPITMNKRLKFRSN